jgi:hypothetical protein
MERKQDMSQSIDVLEVPQMPSRLEQDRLKAEAARLIVDAPDNSQGVRNRLELEPALWPYFAELAHHAMSALRSIGYEGETW